MTRTAHGIPRTGPAKVGGEHLEAANQSTTGSTATLASQIARCMDPQWHYTHSGETDVQATWKRFGWIPSPSRRFHT
jgi:hypothetical protein